ncbi:MAG: hydrolase [Phycisphaerae bacterium]
MMNATRLDPDRAALLVIDMQAKLLGLIEDRNRIVEASGMLIGGAGLFELPVLVTEQYPQGIGPTDSELSAELKRVGAEVLCKTTFSACGDQAVRVRLREIDREQIILCGIETHVCVQQTAMDLLTMDYQVFVCADAVGSRGHLDYDTALHRMRRAGAAVTTVEAVLFELCQECGTPRFKAMLEIIKSRGRLPAFQSEPRPSERGT